MNEFEVKIPDITSFAPGIWRGNSIICISGNRTFGVLSLGAAFDYRGHDILLLRHKIGKAGINIAGVTH
jgi:hypothetical protein